MGEQRDSKLMDILQDNEYINLSLNYFPNTKALKAIYLYYKIQIMLYHYAMDVEGKELDELIHEPPQRENFSSDDDYQNAVNYYNSIKSMLSTYSKHSIRINLHDLDSLESWKIPFEAIIASLNGIKGYRFNILTTERSIQMQQAMAKKKGGGFLSSIFGNNEE